MWARPLPAARLSPAALGLACPGEVLAVAPTGGVARPGPCSSVQARSHSFHPVGAPVPHILSLCLSLPICQHLWPSVPAGQVAMLSKETS